MLKKMKKFSPINLGKTSNVFWRGNVLQESIPIKSDSLAYKYAHNQNLSYTASTSNYRKKRKVIVN